MHNAIMPALAVFSVLTAGSSAVDLYVSKTTLPIVEGYATRIAPVRAGEDIRLEWNITKRTDCEGVSSRVWAGSNGFRMTESQKSTALPKTNGVEKYRFQTHIPNKAPSGKLTLNIKGYYDCSKGREYWSLSPVTLRVVDGTGGGT